MYMCKNLYTHTCKDIYQPSEHGKILYTWASNSWASKSNVNRLAQIKVNHKNNTKKSSIHN